MGEAQDDLWGSVEPRLYVGVQLLGREAGGTKVDELQGGGAVAGQVNIRGLQNLDLR